MDLKDPNKVNCQNVCTQKNMLILVMANIGIKTSWCIREAVKYYFADFVHKGGGGTPQIRNSFFAR